MSSRRALSIGVGSEGAGRGGVVVCASVLVSGRIVPVIAAWDWDCEEDGRGVCRGYLRRCGEMRVT